ncbi:MAG: SO2930 family diheme c-type cytochrome [Pseudomonadota bacterium]
MQRVLISTAALAAVLALASCSPAPEVRFFTADAYPERLSAWGVLRSDGNRLELGNGFEPYDLNTALFTDYAQKLRAIYLPPGTAAVYDDYEAFDFPVGSIIAKTFFYPKGGEPGVVRASYQWTESQRGLDRGDVEVLETRLLVRQAEGWDALPYVWRGDEAYLTLAGTLTRLTLEHTDGRQEPLPYIVPTRNECAACHATDHSSGEFLPIGPKARHLNRGYLDNGQNQLTTMAAQGRLSGLPELESVAANARSQSSSGGHDDQQLDGRARAYLDINCGHCHNPKGAADTSGLLLDAATTSSRALGICKPPIAAGQGTGGRAYSIVPGSAQDSIMVFRMVTDDPGARMPELGRMLVHESGGALISRWIDQLAGECIEQGGAALTGD